MSINTRLYNETRALLRTYGCFNDDMNTFLFNSVGFLARQQQAIGVIETMMTMHGKEELLKHVVELARIEHGIRELEPWVRDHVVHALLTFILGVHIKENYFLNSHANTISYFQWKLTGLFHDIGYPVQISNDILKSYTKRVNEIKRNIGVTASDIQLTIVPRGLEKLQNGKNSLSLIQDNLNIWQLNINAQYEYDNMILNGKICHGILSGLTVLYVIDLMYQRYNPQRLYRNTYASNNNINWNQYNFENEVVPACSAIFIHNLPHDRFSGSKISSAIAPLPFLLRLCDILQEWERPSLNNINGVSSTEFDIKFENQNLIFLVENPLIKNKISNELNLTLNTDRIRIVEK